jgi:hypothetical protein
MRVIDDWYEVLQVSPHADPEVIEGAYRRLALKYHPDVNASSYATERMRKINEAYEILRDPAHRARYDRTRRTSAEPDPEPAVPPTDTDLGLAPIGPLSSFTRWQVGAAGLVLIAVVLLTATYVRSSSEKSPNIPVTGLGALVPTTTSILPAIPGLARVRSTPTVEGQANPHATSVDGGALPLQFWTVCIWCDFGTQDPKQDADNWASRLELAGFPGNVVDSTHYPSLMPGYWVTYSGSFDTNTEAVDQQTLLQHAGFSGEVRLVSAADVRSGLL